MKENDYATLTFCPGCRVKVTAIQGDQAAIKIKGDNTARLPLSELTPCEFTGLTLPVWLVEGAKVEERLSGTRHTITQCGRSYIDCEESDGTVSHNRIIDFLRFFEPTNSIEEVTEPAQPKETEPVKTDDHPATTVTPPSDDDMAAAANLLFGGLAKSIKKDLLKEIMAKVQPILDRAPVEHVHTINIDDYKTKFPSGEIFHPKFEEVLTWLANGFNVYIYGPAGTGKTHMAKQLAKAMGKDFYFCNKVDDSLDITGFVDANGVYNETPFYKGFTSNSLFLFDEYDGSHENAVLKTNSALDNRMFDVPKYGNIQAHEGFVCLAAGNTNGMGPDATYVGRNKLDPAAMQRFGAVIEFDYDPRIEEIQSGGDAQLLDFTRACREASKELQLNDVIISYRNISAFAFATRQAIYKDRIKDAMSVTLWRGLDIDSINTIKAKVISKIGSSNKYLKYCV